MGAKAALTHLGLIFLIGLWEDLDIVKEAQRKDIPQRLSPIFSIVQLSRLQHSNISFTVIGPLRLTALHLQFLHCQKLHRSTMIIRQAIHVRDRVI